MPYGVTQQQWDAMNDYGRHLAKQSYGKKQNSPTTSNPKASIPQDVWNNMPDNVKSNIVGTAQNTGVDPTPGKIAGNGSVRPTPKANEAPAPTQPIVQQSSFDPREYIKELQDEAKSKPTKGLWAAMTKELLRIG